MKFFETLVTVTLIFSVAGITLSFNKWSEDFDFDSNPYRGLSRKSRGRSRIGFEQSRYRRPLRCTFDRKTETIIRLNASLKLGASFLNSSSSKDLDDCQTACCKNFHCSVAVFRQKDEEGASRCYHFDCGKPNVCKFTEHSLYTSVHVSHVDTKSSSASSSRRKSHRYKLPADNKDPNFQTAEVTAITTVKHGENTKVHYTGSSSVNCKRNQFKCRDSGGSDGSGPACIPMYDVCNGIRQCKDGSDEVGCTEDDKPSQTTKAVTHEVRVTSTDAESSEDTVSRAHSKSESDHASHASAGGQASSSLEAQGKQQISEQQGGAYKEKLQKLLGELHDHYRLDFDENSGKLVVHDSGGTEGNSGRVDDGTVSSKQPSDMATQQHQKIDPAVKKQPDNQAEQQDDDDDDSFAKATVSKGTGSDRIEYKHRYLSNLNQVLLSDEDAHEKSAAKETGQAVSGGSSHKDAKNTDFVRQDEHLKKLANRHNLHPQYRAQGRYRNPPGNPSQHRAVEPAAVRNRQGHSALDAGERKEHKHGHWAGRKKPPPSDSSISRQPYPQEIDVSRGRPYDQKDLVPAYVDDDDDDVVYYDEPVMPPLRQPMVRYRPKTAYGDRMYAEELDRKRYRPERYRGEYSDRYNVPHGRGLYPDYQYQRPYDSSGSEDYGHIPPSSGRGQHNRNGRKKSGTQKSTAFSNEHTISPTSSHSKARLAAPKQNTSHTASSVQSETNAVKSTEHGTEDKEKSKNSKPFASSVELDALSSSGRKPGEDGGTTSYAGVFVIMTIGVTATIVALVIVVFRFRRVGRRGFGRRGRPLTSGEADYLINGMYL